MANETNKRETGARIFPAKSQADANDSVSQEAASNRPPADGMGNAAPGNETPDKTRQSDGRAQGKTPSPDAEKLGAGPPTAEHSKDAKAPRGGRQPSAYVKK